MKPTSLSYLIKTVFSSSRPKPILKLLIGLFWAFGIALVGWLIYQYRFELWNFMAGANYWHLFGFLFFYAISFIMGATAWGCIMRAFSPEIPFLTHIKIFTITLAGRRLPGTFWYIGGRAIYYQELKASLLSVSLASLLEMISWVISGLLLGALLIPSILDWAPGVMITFRLIAIAGFFLFHPRLISWALKKLKRPLLQTLHYRDTLTWLFLTAAGWVAGGGMVIELANAFKPIRTEDYLYFLGAWAIAGALGLLTFLLPSSFGLTEISLATMLSVRLPLSLAIVISILQRIFTILIEYLLSILLYAFKMSQRNIHDSLKDSDE